MQSDSSIDRPVDRRVLALFFGLSVVLALLFLNPFIGHWDSYDYMKYILTNQRTSLMLGRPYFIYYNHLLWRLFALFGLPPSEAYLVVKMAIVLFAGLTSCVFYLFFLRLTDRRIAWIATALMISSPVYVVYSGMVMTEIPMMLAIYGGLYLFQIGLDRADPWRLCLGAVCCGVAIGIREQAIFLTPYLVLAPFLTRSTPFPRRWLWIVLAWFAGLVASIAGPLYLLITDPGYWPTIKKWVAFMREQKGRHPIDWTNFLIWLKWIVANQPVAALPALVGFVGIWRSRRERLPQLGFVALSIALLISLAWYQDLLYSPRYMLIVMPAVALAGGVGIATLFERLGERRLAILLTAIQLSILAASFIVMLPYRPVFSKAKTYHTKIRNLPETSVFIVGQYCPYIGYLKSVGYPPTWDVICAGWTWPRKKLRGTIDGYLSKGFPVYIDTDQVLWFGPRLQQDFADWKRIAAGYSLTRIDGTLFQIKPRK